jgi:O-antigen ligase
MIVKITLNKTYNLGNVLIGLILTGQFIGLAFENILSIQRLYFTIVTCAFLYFFRIWLLNSKKINIYFSDIFWFSFFIYVILSAVFFGISYFFDFINLFFFQVIFAYCLGRIINTYPNINSLTIILNKILIAYIIILIIIYIKDPDIFYADRFHPFVDRSSESSGGKPTQVFLGYGLSCILLSNYIYMRQFNFFTKFDFITKFFFTTIALSLILLIGSRASLLSLFFAILIYELNSKITINNFLVSLLILILIVCLVVILIPNERIDFFKEFEVIFKTNFFNLSCVGALEGSFLYRISGIFQSIDLFLENPLFGVGVGNYGWFYCGEKNDFIYPHNILMQLLAETGFFGTCLFLTCIFVMLIKIIKNNKKDAALNIIKPYKSHLYYIWLFYFFEGFLSGNYYANILFYFITGMLVTQSNWNKRIDKSKEALQKSYQRLT